jgi:hypothetical protein
VFGNKEKLVDELTKGGGTVAWATVLDAKTGWASGSGDGFGRVSNETDHMGVKVRVEPDGQEPFEADFKQAFKGMIPIKGFACQVIYDPADHSRIAILGQTITPAGIPHDKAERAIAMREGATKAALTGNMADFVAGLKAKAASGEFAGTLIVDGKVVSGGAAAAPPDVADQLSKLADLHAKGALTDGEFAAAKSKLLGS